MRKLEKKEWNNCGSWFFCIVTLTDCRNVFALMVRSNQELKEKLYSFTITDEEVNKTNYLRSLCRQMANTVCKADAVSPSITFLALVFHICMIIRCICLLQDTFLMSVHSHQLEIDTSDVALGTLSKAFKWVLFMTIVIFSYDLLLLIKF